MIFSTSSWSTSALYFVSKAVSKNLLMSLLVLFVSYFVWIYVHLLHCVYILTHSSSRQGENYHKYPVNLVNKRSLQQKSVNMLQWVLHVCKECLNVHTMLPKIYAGEFLNCILIHWIHQLHECKEHMCIFL